MRYRTKKFQRAINRGLRFSCTDGSGDPATARCLANSLKTSPKAGKLWRSLLKLPFGMINTLMAVLARNCGVYASDLKATPFRRSTLPDLRSDDCR